MIAPALLHDTLAATARASPDATVLVLHPSGETLTYAELEARSRRLAAAFMALGLRRHDRVAVYLQKTPETVECFYASSLAGGAFVPINPLLKPAQVHHILADCEPALLVTSAQRRRQLEAVLAASPSLRAVITVDADSDETGAGAPVVPWKALPAGAPAAPPPIIDNDMAALLYTSGSTGRPKGVILSHRNLVTGAASVARYLGITAEDTLLAVLPFSFDYGLNQLTSAVLQGATCVLLDYLLPRDVLRACERHRVTGLAAVPPLWNQLAPLDWPAAAVETLRYLTNSGGALPAHTLAELRRKLPRARPYLMYGLTEAFRSTYLPPEEIDRRPGAIGKAIPNAEVLVVAADGRLCGPNEPGELVHRGALVALGYWNDPERTRERFRPAPARPAAIPSQEIAVWSGDTVRKDEDGFLYFLGRSDGMIKTSGYRVSPEEVEEVVYASGLVAGAAAVGAEHPQLGQAICLLAVPQQAADPNVAEQLEAHCRQALPSFMVPARIELRAELPQTPNGKIDRPRLAEELAGVFLDAGGDPPP